MATFTKEQVAFIAWLAQGNYIDVCIELCPALGKMTGYESCNGHFQKRTLFKLKAQGFICESVHYITGIRYLRCSISQRGLDWLSTHTEQSHQAQPCMEPIRKAADESNWSRYTELMGGVFCK
ncbi:hypothetical protein [Shewanella benthica]|uniref:Uncharacterized protein n=1 Tax=Shewanella benthica KT99 TaxID=314608 RepID=A9DA98_9GAMM|nr:hypothetical protein [Shewanella benthica]EDQ00729.1 hypothetical protein KT99_15917 [Shewanella benthica KT99]